MVTNDEEDGKLPTRKHPVHGVLFVDGQPTIIFDTVCTKDRASWLTNNAVHRLLRETWQEADAWWMGRYMIMPDHIHFFAAATNSLIPYENWVKYWKSQFSKRHKMPEHRWLTDHWDVRVRNETAYEEKWDYTLQNPVRAALVTNQEDWPYLGVIHDLPWK
jgi:putative transposase